MTFDYDDLGRHTSLMRANGTSTTYGYNAALRLTSLSLTGGNQPNVISFGYNPAQQITSRSSSDGAYAWTDAYDVDRAYGVNGLNQLTSAGVTSLGYDLRGNLTTSGTTSYGYTVDNQLATAPGANLAYDPLGRLFNINAENGVNTTLTYDGADVMTEVNQANGTLLRRYVYVQALAIVAASARKQSRFLPRLADSGRAGLLMLNDNVLAIIRACSQS